MVLLDIAENLLYIYAYFVYAGSSLFLLLQPSDAPAYKNTIYLPSALALLAAEAPTSLVQVRASRTYPFPLAIQ